MRPFILNDLIEHIHSAVALPVGAVPYRVTCTQWADVYMKKCDHMLTKNKWKENNDRGRRMRLSGVVYRNPSGYFEETKMCVFFSVH